MRTFERVRVRDKDLTCRYSFHKIIQERSQLYDVGIWSYNPRTARRNSVETSQPVIVLLVLVIVQIPTGRRDRKAREMFTKDCWFFKYNVSSMDDGYHVLRPPLGGVDCAKNKGSPPPSYIYHCNHILLHLMILYNRLLPSPVNSELIIYC